MKYGFYTLDVFTDNAFGGNPLAVFPHAEGIDAAIMQRIARELNLSETVFVGVPSSENRFPVRIFTPACEIPFAGHPTVGTAYLLGELGLVDGTELVLEEGVGAIPVTLVPEKNTARFQVAMLPEIIPSHLSAADVAGLLQLVPEQVVRVPFIASCGLPFQMLELVDADAVDQAELNLAQWKSCFPDKALSDLYLYCHDGDGLIYSRMFSPAFNIPEDPATGSAAAALTGALAVEMTDNGVVTFCVEQGVRMGRPSQIRAQVDVKDGVTAALSIQGQSVLISEGRFLL